MSFFKRVYVAASSQHVGKTTSTLGLIAALQHQHLEVGYCKPVGQRHVEVNGGKVDKDAHLFASFLGFDLIPELHSPVILGSGAVTSYLDHPGKYDYPTQIMTAAQCLEKQYDVVVYEGTGHPGVGSTVGVSNADVAKMLGAGVVFVAEAGIGSTLDQLALSMALFREKKVPILGVIINKTQSEKLPKVQKYIEIHLQKLGVPLLGLLPYEEELTLPLIGNVCRAVGGAILQHPEGMNKRIRSLVAGSDVSEEKIHQGHLLLVSTGNRLESTIKGLIQKSTGREGSPLTGVVLCGEAELSESVESYLQAHKLPVIHTGLDTYEVFMAVSKIEVKINARTPWKVRRAVELFKDHIHPERMMQPA